MVSTNLRFIMKTALDYTKHTALIITLPSLQSRNVTTKKGNSNVHGYYSPEKAMLWPEINGR